MPARLVQPALSALLGGGLASDADEASGAPLDLEALFRRAATAAVAASINVQDADCALLADENLEALACIACEVLGDGASADNLEEQRSMLVPELIPLFDEAMVSKELRDRIVDALLAAARGANEPSTETLKLTCRPPPPSRPPPVSDNKYRRRGEVEQARAEEYLQEHEKQIEFEKATEEARERVLAEFYNVPVDVLPQAHGAPGAFNPAAAAGVAPASPDSSDSEEEVEDAATTRDREATKQRLRELGEPATLFGERDEVRTERLNQLELSRDQDVLASGSVNVLQMVNKNAQRGINMDHDEDDFNTDRTKKPLVPLPALCDNDGAAPPLLPTDDKDDEELDELDGAIKTASLWLRSTLREWETELTSRQAAEKDRRSFADERGQFRQSKQYLRPLRKLLKEGSISPGIVASLAAIADCCDKREYKEAKEAYMRLAIGNQAWPMGVTMATFHDRPNRHLIGEDNVAHILNDETTRKYVHVVKRLVSYSETRWPINPSDPSIS